MSRTLLLVTRAQREIDKLQARGVIRARRLSVRIKQAVNGSLRSKKFPAVRALILKEMTPTLRDAMVASHLRGLLAERAIISRGANKGKGLQLSVFDNVIANLARTLKVDTRALQLQYQTQAIRILNETTDDIELKLRQTVNELIQEGAQVPEGVRVLKQRMDALGMTPQKDFRLESIFRTQTQMAYGAGRWEADQDPAVQEILWGYTYSAVGDERTREEHAALDGVTLPKSDPLWERIWPPNGWNCRCQVIPIFEEEPVKAPPSFLSDGVTPVEPDAGFAFNPGRVFASERTASRTRESLAT